MDCQTARLLLGLARDCGPDDAAVLDAHLADCGGCQGFAAAQIGFDAAVALAMKSVPLPTGGAERAVREALVKRAAVVRRQWLLGAGGVLAAVIVAVVSYGVFLGTRPRVDTAELAQTFDYRRDDPERFVAEWLRANRLPAGLPHRLNYRFLLDATRSDVDGKSVPCLQFVRGNETLRVYILSRSQFRLDGLQAAQSSFATVQTVPESPAHPGFAYLLLYTSPTLDPFLLND